MCPQGRGGSIPLLGTFDGRNLPGLRIWEDFLCRRPPVVQLPLKPDEQVADVRMPTQFLRGVEERAVAQLEEARELTFVELTGALLHVMIEHEPDERTLLGIERAKNGPFPQRYPQLA